MRQWCTCAVAIDGVLVLWLSICSALTRFVLIYYVSIEIILVFLRNCELGINQIYRLLDNP